MTDLKVGSVWQTDISGKWATPSLQGNTYTIGFFERKSKKIFLYFSKSKEMSQQTKDLIASEIPKCRLRHGTTDFIIHSDVGEFQSEKIREIVRAAGGEIEKGSAYTPEHQCFIERGWRTIKELASTMLLASNLTEPYWECAQQYANKIYCRTVRPVGENNELLSPDDVYYGVRLDMQNFQPFGCKAYIHIAKQVRRKNHKGSAELAIFVGFDDNTIPGYKFYRPLYRDFVTTVHARFMKFTRRTDINLHQQSDDSGDKEGTVADFEYLVGTVHRDDVDGLVYETVRVVEESYQRRGTFIVAYRRLVYKNGVRGPEDKDAIHVRDIEKMTASTDEEILDEYGVAPEEAPSPDEHDAVSLPRATGSYDSTDDVPIRIGIEAGKRSSVRVSDELSEMCSPCALGERGSEQDNTGSDVAPAVSGSRGRPGSVENGPISGYRRKRAAERLEAAGAGWPPTKRRESSISSHIEKTGSVSRFLEKSKI